jgi:cholesterol transport system auxiliary component
MKPYVLLVAGFLGGCALTSKGDALTIRYFSPEQAPVRLTSSETGGAPQANAKELRLGRITSGQHLRDKIVYRDNDWEVGFYDDRRWTERPETYVRRELARALFEDDGLTRAVSGPAPTLDVEVLSFEELKLARGHFARIAVRAVLYGDDKVLFEETFTVDRPVASNDPSALAAAMAEALHATGEMVGKRVTASLSR